MTITNSRRLGVLAAALFAMAACNGAASGTAPASSAGAPSNSTSSQPAPANLSGTVTIDGSSTVYPITEAVAEEFQLANTGVQVPTSLSGTGGGFKKFCVGETDINDASRPIKAEDEGEGAGLHRRTTSSTSSSRSRSTASPSSSTPRTRSRPA